MNIVLAIVLLGDVALSIRPLPFIRKCLEGVGFPEQWWWVLLVIKTLAAIGLLTGFEVAASAGTVVYFLCAVVAHIRARFVGREFWLNCLGMLALAVATLIVSY